MRKWLLNGSLGIATLVVLIAVGELGVRALSPFPSWEPETSCGFPDRYDARLGWSGIPSLDQPFVQHEFKIRVETNDLGFRDESFAAKLARSERLGTRRLVLLGDSFVWGWGVERAQRFGERLEALTGDGVTFNLAQSGWGTDQQYLTYLDHGGALKADVVLLLFFSNDFDDVNAAVRYEGQRKPRFVRATDGLALTNVPVPYDRRHWERKRTLAQRLGDCPPPDRPQWRVVLDRSRHCTSFSQLANWLHFRVEQLVAAQPASPPVHARQLVARASVTLALIDALTARVAEDSAHFLLVLVPEKRQVLDGKPSGAWQEVLLEHCERADLPCLDLLPAFAGHGSAYFRIDSHWNASGHRLAAEQIHAFVMERGWLSASGADSRANE